MSDLFGFRQKLTEGADWRGTITVPIGEEGEEYELTVRQLRDPELYEVMEMIDLDELEDFEDELPQDALDRYDELQEKENLTEDEEEELDELREELESSTSSIFTRLDLDSFEGIRLAGKYGVEPDQEDITEVTGLTSVELKEYFGTPDENPEVWGNLEPEDIKGPRDAKKLLKQDLNHKLDNATNFVSFVVGMEVIGVTVGDEGKSESS